MMIRSVVVSILPSFGGTRSATCAMRIVRVFCAMRSGFQPSFN